MLLRSCFVKTLLNFFIVRQKCLAIIQKLRLGIVVNRELARMIGISCLVIDIRRRLLLFISFQEIVVKQVNFIVCPFFTISGL